MSQIEDFYDASARAIRRRLERSAKERGVGPIDKQFGDAWEAALASDLRKRAGIKTRRVKTANERDAERTLLR